MPLGIISDEELNSELKDEKPAVVVDIVRGRGDKKETPEVIRKVIADEGINGASNEELAKTFNVSESSVSAYKNGATSTKTYNEPNKGLNKFISSIRERALDKSATVLERSLDALSNADLSDTKPRDLAAIAKDTSAIIKNLIPEKEADGPTVQFIFFAPQPHKEDFYDVIDVRASEEAR